MTKKTFIFDIDGTLANLDHRLSYIESTPKNWEAFHLGYVFDSPIMPVVRVLRSLADSESYQIVIITARMETPQGKSDTIAWLKEHDIKYDALYMRPERNYDDAWAIKKEIVETKLTSHDIIGVFDDRPSVVKMWRDMGIFVFDCNQTERSY